ncbi:hypothetical protein CH366_10085 [Leptospira harrisiae]|nr:hypothetical protein CH366_10085 [Leptospira harrisiae]
MLNSKEEENHIEFETKIRKIKLIIKLLIAFGLFLFLPILLNKQFSLCIECTFENYDELSKIGDYFSGTIGLILNFIGLLLIYLTFLGQKQDILIQQFELKQNQEILKAQQNELADQNKNIVRDRFENTFFNLIKTINVLKNGYTRGDITGPDNFKKQITHLINSIAKDKTFLTNKKDKYASSEFYFSFQNYISHIMNILDYVELSNLSTEEKLFYIKTLRSILSVHELLFIEVAYKSTIFSKTKSPLINILLQENSNHFKTWEE